MKIPTSDICDLYSDTAELGLQVALPGLRSFGSLDFLAGPAFTISCTDDNVLIRETVMTVGGGRILVIDGHASPRHALLGDIQTERAMRNGWGGVIVNGYVRDALALAALPFAVFALGTVPLRPLKARTGAIGVNLDFLNVSISPGMWVYADADGLVVLNHQAPPLDKDKLHE